MVWSGLVWTNHTKIFIHSKKFLAFPENYIAISIKMVGEEEKIKEAYVQISSNSQGSGEQEI